MSSPLPPDILAALAVRPEPQSYQDFTLAQILAQRDAAEQRATAAIRNLALAHERMQDMEDRISDLLAEIAALAAKLDALEAEITDDEAPSPELPDEATPLPEQDTSTR